VSASRVLFEHPDVRAMAVDRVIATAWRRAPRVDVIEALEAHVKTFHDEHADGAVLVILPAREAPDEAARRALQAFLERMAPSLLGAAVVLALGGVKGAILRGVAAGVVAAMRLPLPIKLMGSTRDAAAYAVEVLGRSSRPPLVADIEKMLRDAEAP